MSKGWVGLKIVKKSELISGWPLSSRKLGLAVVSQVHKRGNLIGRKFRKKRNFGVLRGNFRSRNCKCWVRVDDKQRGHFYDCLPMTNILNTNII